MENKFQVTNEKNPLVYMPSEQVIKDTVNYLDEISKEHMDDKSPVPCKDQNCPVCFASVRLMENPLFVFAVAQNMKYSKLGFSDMAQALVMAMYFFLLGMKSQQSSFEGQNLENKLAA